jgi:hypothetical protein
MGCAFDIDSTGKPKIEIAKETILTLLDQLKPDDKLGIVLFDHRCTVSFFPVRLHCYALTLTALSTASCSSSVRASLSDFPEGHR